MAESKPNERPSRRSLYDENFNQSWEDSDVRAISGVGIDLNLGRVTPTPTSVVWSQP
jgi:hypothetical protein